MSGEITTELGSLDNALGNLEEMSSSGATSQCKNCAKPPSSRRVKHKNIKSGQANGRTEAIKLVPYCPECGEEYWGDEDSRSMDIPYEEWKGIAKTKIRAMVDESDSGHPFSLRLHDEENALVRPPRNLPTDEIVAYVMDDEVHLFEIHQDSPEAVLESLQEVNYDHYHYETYESAVDKLDEIDDEITDEWCEQYPYGEKVVAAVALLITTGNYHYKVHKYIGRICPKHRIGELRDKIGYEYPG